MTLDRRRFLSGISALAFSATAGRLRAVGAPGAFRFVVVNDLHHGAPDCDAFFEGLVARLRTHAGVELYLVGGDITDAGKPESLAAMARILGTLGRPVHAVPGNHDCDVEENTRLYEEAFPGPINRVFTHGGWRFIALDTTDGKKWGGSVVGAHTLEFLDRSVPELDRETPTVVFTHFPLVAEANPKLTPVNAAEVLRRLAPLNVRGVFTGHYHARTRFTPGGFEVETNACCSRLRANHDGTRTEGYLLCSAHADGTLEREFVEYEPASKVPPPVG